MTADVLIGIAVLAMFSVFCAYGLARLLQMVSRLDQIVVPPAPCVHQFDSANGIFCDTESTILYCKCGESVVLERVR